MANLPKPSVAAAALNELWPLLPALQGGGWRRAVARKLSRLLARVVHTQERFNARQVQFDNEILDYVDARLDVTHRHYDSVLGIHSRHMAEIDERHLIVQEELVAHVHDLVKRIEDTKDLTKDDEQKLTDAMKDWKKNGSF